MGAAPGPVVEKGTVLATRCPLGTPGCQCKHPEVCQAQHWPVVWATGAEAGQVPEDC